MGHNKRSHPQKGSRQVWPRKRARRETPRVRNQAKRSEVKPLGFAGYKAGMTHILYVNNTPKSPTKGEEIITPVTILECPDLKVAALRFYSDSKVLFDVWSDSLDEVLARKIKLPKKKKMKRDDVNLNNVTEIRLLTYTQPSQTPIGKKKPELFETALGGDNIEEKFNYAKELLGKSISVDQVFKAGEYLDIHAVTTGKGFQGVVKRFGVKLRQKKSEKGQRRTGTMGPWTPKKTPWWIPMPGQMGYHTRTEYNKQLLKIGEGDITPHGGLARYGEVRGKYILLAGSVAGPKKRLIRLTHAVRNHGREDVPNITFISRRSQQ